jgi:ABC-2 type transport system permease protein
MSATAATATLPPRADTRPSLGRLTAVELRKMTDTRAGMWLQIAVAAATLVVVVLTCVLGHAQDHTLRNILANAVQPASILLPVVGILLVTSEFSQRTALITFTHVPQRSRVLAAKLAASIVLSLIALALCLGVSVLATAIADPGLEHTWSLPAGLFGQVAIYLTTAMVGGVAFGAALLSSAPAIVLSYVLPISWSAIGSIHAVEPAARWLDGSRSLSPLTEHLMHGTEWARAGTTLAVWMVLPLAIGLWRILRAEIR